MSASATNAREYVHLEQSAPVSPTQLPVTYATSTQGECIPFPNIDSFAVGPVHKDMVGSELEKVLTRMSDTRFWTEPINKNNLRNYFIEHMGTRFSLLAPVGEDGERYIVLTRLNEHTEPLEWLVARVEYIRDRLQESGLLIANQHLRPSLATPKIDYSSPQFSGERFAETAKLSYVRKSPRN